MQSGIHAANTIKRRLDGKEAVAFKYRDLGSMATVARFRAIVEFKGLRLSGFAGWLMWLAVHITFLTGFKNRFMALLHWTNTFASGGRAERAITLRQVMARVALQRAGGEEFMRSVIASQRELKPVPDQHRRTALDDGAASGPADATAPERRPS